MELPIVSLVLYGVAGLVVAIWIARKLGRPLNFRTLLIGNYVLVIIASGVVHLMRVPNQPRGFYDVAGASGDVLGVSTIGSILGLVAVCAGCLWRLPKATGMHHPEMTRADRWIAALVVLAIAPLALSGLQQMAAYAAASDTVRIISIDQGLARYVFASHWTVWLICLSALWLMSFNPFRGRFWSVVLVGGAVVGSAAALAWTGGRSIIIVMALPIALLMAHRLRSVRWLIVPAAVVVAGIYFLTVTQERLAGTRLTSSLGTWIDWEWGRFSMIGFAESRVAAEGFLYGETFFAAIANVGLGLLRFTGIPIMNPDLRSMPEITGEILLGNTQTYVVAGYVSELYINFGYVGIILGMLLLGLVTGWVDQKYAQAKNLLVQFAWAYLGVLLVFRTLAADANSIGSYLLYSGLPVLVAAALALIPWGTRSKANPASRARKRALATV